MRLRAAAPNFMRVGTVPTKSNFLSYRWSRENAPGRCLLPWGAGTRVVSMVSMRLRAAAPNFMRAEPMPTKSNFFSYRWSRANAPGRCLLPWGAAHGRTGTVLTTLGVPTPG